MCARLRIPLKYLANLLTAGKEEPVALGARAHAGDARLYAGQDGRRRDRREHRQAGRPHRRSPSRTCTSIMAIANYEDRFVIPTAHREVNEDAYDLRGSCGFSFGNGCSGGTSETNLFGTPRSAPRRRWRSCDDQDPQGALGAADLSDRSSCSRRPARSATAIDAGAADPGAHRAASCTRC